MKIINITGEHSSSISQEINKNEPKKVDDSWALIHDPVREKIEFDSIHVSCSENTYLPIRHSKVAKI